MKNALALITIAALTLIAVAASGPVKADHGLVPVIPGEAAGAPIGGVVADGYRCSEGPVYNFYHGAWYGGYPPAIYLGYAYRPYYRYTAWRVSPRTYACARWPHDYDGWHSW